MSIFKKFFTIFLLLCFFGTSGLVVYPYQAQALFGLGDIVFDPLKYIWDTTKDAWKSVGAVAFKQALKQFVNRYAYESAVYIASGGKGQKPLIWTNYKEELKKSGDAALGDFVAALGEEWTGINLCEPPPYLKAKFLISLKEIEKPPFYEAERCSFSEIQENLRGIKLKDLVRIDVDVDTTYVNSLKEIDEIARVDITNEAELTKAIEDMADSAIGGKIKARLEKIEEKIKDNTIKQAFEKAIEPLGQGDKELVNEWFDKNLTAEQRKTAILKAKKYVNEKNENIKLKKQQIKLYNQLQSILDKIQKNPPTEETQGEYYLELSELSQKAKELKESFYETYEDFYDKFEAFMQREGCNPSGNCVEKCASNCPNIYNASFFYVGRYITNFQQALEKLEETAYQLSQDILNGDYTEVKPSLADIAKMFNPEANDLGRFLALSWMAEEKKREKEKETEFEQKLGEGFKAVKSTVSGAIKTPASIVQEATKNVLQKAGMPEGTYTGDLIADAIGIFTNTLTSQWIKRIFEKGFNPLTEGRFLEPGQTGVGIAAAKTIFSSINTPPPFAGAGVDVLAELQSEKIIDSKFAQAIEEKLSVKEALDKGLLIKSWPFAYTSLNSEPEFNQGYGATNMKKLRLHRIIPLAWQIAAEKIYKRMKDGETRVYSLEEVVSCFSDEKCPLEKNFFQGLVDPNWVLKAPQGYCKAKAYSALKEDKTDLRKEVCVDYQSCLKENEDGTCQKFGYCLEEKDIWRFKGTRCSEEFDKCRVYKDSKGKELAFLKDTLSSCSAEAGGCKKYFQADDWDNDRENRIYLNARAKECPLEDAGCAEYISLANEATKISEDDYLNESFYLNGKTRSCRLEEVGCKKYTRLFDNLELTGVLKTLCPKEAEGCKQYFEYFEDLYGNEKQVAGPISFIQNKTKPCPADDVTCEEYTNLETPPEKGEELAYFKQNSVKQCTKEIQADNCQNYYSWVGNIEQGYKLEVDTFAKKGISGQTGYGTGDSETQCDKSTWEEENKLGLKFKTCQQYFDQTAKDHYFKTDFQFKPITCAEDCTKFRRTSDQKEYFVSPSQALTCSAASKGCTLYKTPQEEEAYLIKDSIEGARCEGFEGCAQYREEETKEIFYFMQGGLDQIGCPAGCLRFINTKNTDDHTDDAIVNLVKEKDALCPETSQYCQRLYLANEDNPTTPTDESEYAQTTSLYLFNDPNKPSSEKDHPYYAQCSSKEIGCQEYSTLTGKEYFKKPYDVCSWQKDKDGVYKWLKPNGEECKEGEISTNENYKMGYSKSCPEDMGGCTKYIDQEDNQKYFYLRDSVDSSCYEENKKEGCKKFTDTGDNSEKILKVDRDRECAKWLDCIAQSKRWDKDKDEYKTICYAYASCSELGPNNECAEYIDESKNDGVRYDQSTDTITNLKGNESGYTLLNQYPISRMTQVKKPDWTDFKLMVNENNNIGKSCRGYPEKDSPRSYGVGKGNQCEKDKNCDCSYKRVEYDDKREKFTGISDSTPEGFKDRQGNTSVPVKEDSYYGWRGYCLEENLNVPLDENPSQGVCLTWYPVDLAEGELDSFSSDFRVADIGLVDGDWKGNYGFETLKVKDRAVSSWGWVKKSDSYNWTEFKTPIKDEGLQPASDKEGYVDIGGFSDDHEGIGCSQWLAAGFSFKTEDKTTVKIGTSIGDAWRSDFDVWGQVELDGYRFSEKQVVDGERIFYEIKDILPGEHIIRWYLRGADDKCEKRVAHLYWGRVYIKNFLSKVVSIPTENKLGGSGIKLQTYKDYKKNSSSFSGYHDFPSGDLLYSYETQCKPFGAANLPKGCETGISGCPTALPYYDLDCKTEAGGKTYYQGNIDHLRKLFVKGDIYSFNPPEYTNKCLPYKDPESSCSSCPYGYNLEYREDSSCNTTENERCIAELDSTIKKGYESGCLSTGLTLDASSCPSCPSGFDKLLFISSSDAAAKEYNYIYVDNDKETETDCAGANYQGLCVCQKNEPVEGYTTQCLDQEKGINDCPVCPNGFDRQIYDYNTALSHGFRECKTSEQLCICKRGTKDKYPTICQEESKTIADCPEPDRGFKKGEPLSNSQAVAEGWEKCPEKEKACICKAAQEGVGGYQKISEWNDMYSGKSPEIHKARWPDQPSGSYTDQGSGIMVNNKDKGEIKNEGKDFVNAVVTFFAMADPNQVPIREIYIDWDDGMGYKKMAEGSFPNHVEDKTKLTDKYCKDSSICIETPFIFVKTYTEKGTYTPKVRVVDNWGREKEMISEVTVKVE